MPGLVQWIKDPALPQLQCRWQLWLRFDPWPRNSICHQVAKKEKRKKKKKSHIPWRNQETPSSPLLGNCQRPVWTSAVQYLSHVYLLCSPLCLGMWVSASCANWLPISTQWRNNCRLNLLLGPSPGVGGEGAGNKREKWTRLRI